MSEKDYAPLSTACVRALNEKVYEKRKAAALEIEKMVKEFAAVNNTAQINKILKVLGQDFATSQNAQTRKGGLIGLAAVAIALGKDTALYSESLIAPILASFSDADAKIRYSACESLYNVVKVTRSAVLTHFAPIFSALNKIATDPDQAVKNASELLDRLMKDIVTESNSFDVDGFVPLLREHIYTKNTFARQFIISWISVLDAVPDIDLIVYLPELLDGLFRILDDPDVNRICESLLGEFLLRIKSDPSRADFSGMINVLIEHAQEKTDNLVQLTAITWIKEFVQLSGTKMLPFLSGIFTAVLPCLAYDMDSRRMTDIKETATAVNFSLMKLITIPIEETNTQGNGDCNQGRHELNLKLVVDVLTQYLSHNSVQTKVAVLKWIHHLYFRIPDKMFSYIDDLFPELQRTLSDPSDEVVQQSLVVIAEIISSPTSKTDGAPSRADTNYYYTKFIVSLLQSFSKDKRLLDERGSFIIRQLCLLLNAGDIYRTLAQILKTEENLRFAGLMVQELNMILLTSSELFELRMQLKDLKSKESCAFFCCLYETWCHNPIATVALCLLSQNYNHVCDLIKIFGNLEITVEFLTEIDKLIQLIESPIFAYLRLELLEVPCDQSLVRMLYGLLMLLPQTEAFHTLRMRLSCIPSLHLHCDNRSQTEIKPIPDRMKHIDYKKLLEHFQTVQENHRHFKKIFRAKESFYLERDMSNLNH